MQANLFKLAIARLEPEWGFGGDLLGIECGRMIRTLPVRE
jgi:hypothetical protein